MPIERSIKSMWRHDMKTTTWVRGTRQLATILVLAIGGASITATAHAEQTDLLERIKSTGVIRIANTQASPPWSMLDEKNQLTGYDVAIAKEMAQRMGTPKIKFVGDTYKNFVEGLKTDKYDLVMNDMTPTEMRRKQVDFSIPYGVEVFRIFVRNDNTDITDKATLAGKKVGVSTGSSNESWAREHLTDSDIRGYDNGSLIFNDIANGRIDAVIISHFGGMKYAHAKGIPVKEVGEPLTYQLAAAALPKGQDALREAVNSALESMLKDGTVERISNEFVGKDYNMLGSIAAAKEEIAAKGK